MAPTHVLGFPDPLEPVDLGPPSVPTPTERARIASAFEAVKQMMTVGSMLSKSDVPSAKCTGMKSCLVAAFIIAALKEKYDAHKDDYASVARDPTFPNDDRCVRAASDALRNNEQISDSQECYNVAMAMVINISDDHRATQMV